MGKLNQGLSVHVVPRRTPSERKFALTEAGKPQPLIRPTTQERAIERARQSPRRTAVSRYSSSDYPDSRQ